MTAAGERAHCAPSHLPRGAGLICARPPSHGVRREGAPHNVRSRQIVRHKNLSRPAFGTREYRCFSLDRRAGRTHILSLSLTDGAVSTLWTLSTLVSICGAVGSGGSVVLSMLAAAVSVQRPSPPLPARGVSLSIADSISVPRTSEVQISFFGPRTYRT
jgi:hypothetical protein